MVDRQSAEKSMLFGISGEGGQFSRIFALSRVAVFPQGGAVLMRESGSHFGEARGFVDFSMR